VIIVQCIQPKAKTRIEELCRTENNVALSSKLGARPAIEMNTDLKVKTKNSDIFLAVQNKY
jgi:hypothetical protein